METKKPDLKGPLLVAAAVIRNANGEILIAQRSLQSAVGGGCWEFPGGKVEAGEHPAAAVIREIKEELDLEIEIESFFGLFSHVYLESGLHVVLAVYRATVHSATHVTGSLTTQWISHRMRASDVLATHTFAAADIPIAESLWPRS